MSTMPRTGPKRGRDNVYEIVKGQYCDPTDEERLSLKTPQTCCTHCNVGQTRNTSEMHWHLCVCAAFGSKEPAFQAMLRTCVPDSILRSHKKKALYLSWQASSTISPPQEEHVEEPKKSGLSAKKPRFTDTRSLCEDANKLIAKWALMYKIPSSAIDSQEFRDIVLLLNPDIYKFPDKGSLSGPLIESIYQQTQSQLTEHLGRCESLQLRIPSETQESGASAQNAAVQVYDGRGSFFYRPLPSFSRRNIPHSQRLLEVAVGFAEMHNNTILSVIPSEREFSEEQNAQLTTTVQAFESAYPQKILVSSAPFSPTDCAELMVSSIAAVHQAVNHAQCILQYLLPSSVPGSIVRSIVDTVGNERVLGPNFMERLKLPEDNSVRSVGAMLEVIGAAQQAGVFNRLLNDGMYQNYCRSLTDSTTAQASLSVQSILVSESAMTGITQAAVALQLLLSASAKAMRPHCATYSDALAVRDALSNAVNKTARLSVPWKSMILQVIASQWEHSYHPLVALASKLDPRRRFGDLPGTMEADAQRLRDKLIARLDPAQRKAVIDSWVQLLKREDCFGEAYALENAHLQSPLDWWIAHTAAHRELREVVAFPALSALGVNLMGNRTHRQCDPAHSGASTEADAADTVRTAELSEDILQSVDLTEKLAFIRRNCWSLHHARNEQRDNAKLQFTLLTAGDLLPTEYLAPHGVATAAAAVAHPAPAAISAYSTIEEFEFAQEHHPHSSMELSSHLPSTHAFADHPLSSFGQSHPSLSPELLRTGDAGNSSSEHEEGY